MVKKILIAAAVTVTALLGTVGAYTASPRHTQDQVWNCVHGLLSDGDNPGCDLIASGKPQ